MKLAFLDFKTSNLPLKDERQGWLKAELESIFHCDVSFGTYVSTLPAANEDRDGDARPNWKRKFHESWKLYEFL